MQCLSIKSIKSLGFQNTLDFEVNHKDHNFYAEGIVTSNSHSISTSYLTALTTYLKYKYPLEFYTACLNEAKNKSDYIEKLGQISSELPYFGIKLLPPDLIKSDTYFKIEDGNIRFSLAAIKGINYKSIDKLRKFQNKYSDKFSIFKGAREAGLPVSILLANIFVGSMDDLIKPLSRSRVALEAQIWNELTDREHVWCFKLGEEYNYDLVEIIRALNEKVKDEKGKPVIKDSRRLTIRKDIAPFLEMYNFNKKNEDMAKYIMEKFYIGFSYSSNLYDIYKDKIDNLKRINEINGELEKTKVKFVGEVIESKQRTSKNKNPYLELYVKDNTGDLKCMIFGGKSNKLEACKEMNGGDYPKNGDIVIVEGTKRDGDTVFADMVTRQNIDIFLKKGHLPKSMKN